MVGVLVGLAFVEKMAAVTVVLPLVAWLAAIHLPPTLSSHWPGEWLMESSLRRPCCFPWSSHCSKSFAWHAVAAAR